MSNKQSQAGRPAAIWIFVLFLLTLAMVGGIGWLYLQEPETTSPESAGFTPITPADLNAIPDGADSGSYTVPAGALNEILNPDDPHRELERPLGEALVRIGVILSNGKLSGRDRWDRAALFLTRLPYDKLRQFNHDLADRLRNAAEDAAAQTAKEKIAEIVGRHHDRIDSKLTGTLGELETGLKGILGEIAPLSPLLKKSEEKGGVISDLNDIVKFLSERRTAESGSDRGAYTVRLEISPVAGRPDDLPEQLTLLDGENEIATCSVTSESAACVVPIREKLVLTIAETDEAITFPIPEERTLAVLGFPALCQAEKSQEVILPQTGIRIRILRTYRLPELLFDGVGSEE